MNLPAQLLKVRFSGEPVHAQELLRMQDNVGSLLNTVAAVPILQAVHLVDVDLGPTAVNVDHGLGRPWTAWLVTDRDAAATVWRSASASPERFLTLTASASVTVALMVW